MEPDSFLSRVCFALQQTRVSASRGTKSTLYRTRSSRKIIRVLEIRPRLIISPLTEIEWKRRRHRREDEFSERERKKVERLCLRSTIFRDDALFSRGFDQRQDSQESVLFVDRSIHLSSSSRIFLNSDFQISETLK